MKRFHVHVAVDDLEANIRFYSTVFGAAADACRSPTTRSGCSKTRASISRSRSAARRPGVDHLGFQVDSDEELSALRKQVADAEIAALDQPDATCCYARSDKYWITDPQGVAWETYRTLGEAEIYGAETKKAEEAGACCSPRPETIGVTPRKHDREVLLGMASAPSTCCSSAPAIPRAASWPRAI